MAAACVEQATSEFDDELRFGMSQRRYQDLKMHLPFSMTRFNLYLPRQDPTELDALALLELERTRLNWYCGMINNHDDLLRSSMPTKLSQKREIYPSESNSATFLATTRLNDNGKEEVYSGVIQAGTHSEFKSIRTGWPNFTGFVRHKANPNKKKWFLCTVYIPMRGFEPRPNGSPAAAWATRLKCFVSMARTRRQGVITGM
ncbi:hypothetical protein C8R46DRAFT_1268747 [Mycena filopes]|nr:hypothetical protein C8R46DRAFT_1268747 [Mycena filopes]